MTGEKGVNDMGRQRRPRKGCTFSKSDQGLCFPLTDSPAAVECSKNREAQMRTFGIWHKGPLLQIRDFFQPKSFDIFLISPPKHTLWHSFEVPCLGKALLMSTHCVCFFGEIRKTFT